MAKGGALTCALPSDAVPESPGWLPFVASCGLTPQVVEDPQERLGRHRSLRLNLFGRHAGHRASGQEAVAVRIHQRGPRVCETTR